MADKTKRHCEPDCALHLFRIHHHASTRHNTHTLFCPKYHREPRLPEATFPVFNTDARYYTSAFVLDVDRRALQRNSNMELAEHTKHVKELLEKQPKIVFPRPNKKHTFCAVCRQNYGNYYAHIMSEQHKAKINANLFNDYILELQDRYKELHVTQPPLIFNLEENQREEGGKWAKGRQDQLFRAARITQIIQKEIIEHIISSDESSGSSSTPRKKYKKYRGRRKLSSSSSGSSSDSSSYESDGSQSSSSKEIQEIDLEDSGSSIQIVEMHSKKDKVYKKQVELGQAKKDPSQKGKAKVPEKRKEGKSIGKTKSEKRQKAAIVLDGQLVLNCQLVLDGQLDKDKSLNPAPKAQLQTNKPDQSLKKAQLKKKYEQIVENRRPSQTLIIKPITNDQDKSMLNILDKIVCTINPCKTAKLKHQLNFIDQPKPSTSKPPAYSQQAKSKTGFDSPFAPPTLKKIQLEAKTKASATTNLSTATSNPSTSVPNTSASVPNPSTSVPNTSLIFAQAAQNSTSLQPKASIPASNQRENNFRNKELKQSVVENVTNTDTALHVAAKANCLFSAPTQKQLPKLSSNMSKSNRSPFPEHKQVQIVEKANSLPKKSKSQAPVKRRPTTQLSRHSSKRFINNNHQITNLDFGVIDIDQEQCEYEAQVQVVKKVEKKKLTQLELIKSYEQRVGFSLQATHTDPKLPQLKISSTYDNGKNGKTNRAQEKKSQKERKGANNEAKSKQAGFRLSQGLLGSFEIESRKIAPVSVPKLSSLVSTSDKDEKMEMACLMLDKESSAQGYGRRWTK